MGNTENFIEINGKRYDAVTGAMVGSASGNTTPVTVHKPVVDGFVKRHKDVSRPHAATIAHAKHHVSSPQKSQTLMRSAVKKPLHSLAASPKKQHAGNAQQVFVAKASVTPRTNTVPQQRVIHAQVVKKSDQVKKFGPAISAAPITVTPMQVRPVPTFAPQQSFAPKQHPKTAELLEKALLAAEGHKETYKEPKVRIHHKLAKKIGVNARTIAVSLTVLAGLVSGGLYAYTHVPNLAMRVASSRAGFQATLPDYKPSGFTFNGPVQYADGQVSVGFKSTTDDRQYKLTQKTTDWTSDSLLNNYLLTNNKQYQTYTDKGRTIYIYDDNSATWVDGGVWYQIEGKSQLTTDQLVRIATSL